MKDQEGKPAGNNVQEKNEDSGNSTLNKNVDGNASSCVIEVQQVWFNFAAPPRTPITRKIDYTRLDWNLLSTASPAINAWMNPSNRFAIRVVHMLRCQYRRNTAVITCLMAEALDVQSLHVPVKVGKTFVVKFAEMYFRLGLINLFWRLAESIWSHYTHGENSSRRSILSAMQRSQEVLAASSRCGGVSKR